MQRVDQGRGGRSRGFRYRDLPLWAQWALPFAVAAALVVALVVWVHHQTNDVPAVANVTNKNAIVEQNREDTILVRQQQRPHVAKLAAGESAAAGLRRAVLAYMGSQISHSVIDGPLKGVSCTAATAGSTTARQVLHCNAVTDSGAGRLTYPFDGVVEPASATITYCQRVQPPVPSMNIPVSRRCT